MALTELERLLIVSLKGLNIPEDEMIGIMLFADQPATQKELVMQIARNRQVTTSDLLETISEMRHGIVNKTQ